MYRILLLALLSTLMMSSVLATPEPNSLTKSETTAAFKKNIGLIRLQASPLEKRVESLSAIAQSLNIQLVTSDSVQEYAEQWSCPPLSLADASLENLLQYTTQRTALVFIVAPGKIRLELMNQK